MKRFLQISSIALVSLLLFSLLPLSPTPEVAQASHGPEHYKWVHSDLIFGYYGDYQNIKKASGYPEPKVAPFYLIDSFPGVREYRASIEHPNNPNGTCNFNLKVFTEAGGTNVLSPGQQSCGNVNPPQNRVTIENPDGRFLVPFPQPYPSPYRTASTLKVLVKDNKGSATTTVTTVSGDMTCGKTFRAPKTCKKDSGLNVELSPADKDSRGSGFSSFDGCDEIDLHGTCTVRVGPGETKTLTLFYGSAKPPDSGGWGPFNNTTGTIISKPMHMHLQTYGEDGTETTGELADGDGDNGELTLLLTDAKGDVLWVVCNTRADGTANETHWFNPVFGAKPKFTSKTEKGIENVDIENRAGCRESDSVSSYSADPTRWYTGQLKVGVVYNIVGVGVGGDFPLIPDSTSQYYDIATLKVTDAKGDRFFYQYSGSSAVEEGTKWKKGNNYVVKYDSATHRDTCTALHPKNHPPCTHEPKPTSGIGYFTFHVFSTEGGGFISILNSALTFMINGIKGIVIIFARGIADAAKIPHSYFVASPGNGVAHAWSIARGFTNTLFVLILIIIALFNILRYNIEKYDVKAAIPRLVIAILLTNFSMFIVGLLVDLSNVGILAVENAFDIPYAGSVSGLGSQFGALVTAASGVILLLQLFVWIAILIMFFGLLLLMVFRIITIIAMTAMAPLAFTAWAFPATSSFLGTWWKNFIRFLMIGPVVAFLLLMAVKFLEAIQGDVTPILMLFTAMVFIAIALMSPIMLGGKAFSTAAGIGKKLGKKLGARALRSDRFKRAAEGKLGAGVTGIKGKLLRGGLSPFTKPTTALLGNQMKLAGLKARGEYDKKRRALDTMRTDDELIKTVGKKDGEGSKNAEDVTSAGLELSKRALLDDTTAKQMLKKAGVHYAEALAEVIKGAADDPELVSAIDATWDQYHSKDKSGNRTIPEKFTSAAKYVATMPASKAAALKAGLIAKPEIRQNVRIDSRSAGSASNTWRTAAFLGANPDVNIGGKVVKRALAEVEDRIKVLRKQVSGKGAEQTEGVRRILEAEFPEFADFGGGGSKGHASRNAMIDSVK